MRRIWNTTITEILLWQGSVLPTRTKTQGKKSNQYWISDWNHMKKLFLMEMEVIFFSDQAAFPKALCTSILYCSSSNECFVYNFWSFIKMHPKEIRLIFKRGQICHMHTKRKALLLSYFTLFSEEQLYKNFMYKLTTSVPSFQNDYPFYNNFWLMFWNCNAYFYAFTFKAHQHPASFSFQPPSTIFYIYIYMDI